MSALFVLIGFSLLVAAGFLIAFIWSVKSGQYEDDYTPSIRILFDDKPKKQEEPVEETKETPDHKTKNTEHGN
ncbi:MAG: cbb3-type cytochrome oxidase assembly protein CcoS [Bacteroidetes bacterium]|nr:cbb3-type cytochrome oxidase assembly protein CcoS [Bacteroidota bacterium]